MQGGHAGLREAAGSPCKLSCWQASRRRGLDIHSGFLHPSLTPAIEFAHLLVEGPGSLGLTGCLVGILSLFL